MKTVVRMGFRGEQYLLKNAVLEFSEPPSNDNKFSKENEGDSVPETQVDYKHFARATFLLDRDGQRELEESKIKSQQSKKQGSSISVVNVFNAGKRKHDIGQIAASAKKKTMANEELLNQMAKLMDDKIAVLEDKILRALEEKSAGKPITALSALPASNQVGKDAGKASAETSSTPEPRSPADVPTTVDVQMPNSPMDPGLDGPTLEEKTEHSNKD